MGNIALSGAKTIAYKAARGTLLEGDGVTVLTTANTWYEIAAKKATGSELPEDLPVTGIFKSPDTGGTQITLADGDDVYPLTLTQMCKTDAEVTCEEGLVDVTDDCEEGFTANILDGYKNITGSLNGFLKFDDETGEIATGAADILGKFFNVVTDDGAGTYVVTAAANEKFLLFICLNKNAAATGVQNWLIVPVLLSSLGTGAGLKDAQKRDLSWSKAQGWASLYQRTVFAADVI
jgi:hypothetical protein